MHHGRKVLEAQKKRDTAPQPEYFPFSKEKVRHDRVHRAEEGKRDRENIGDMNLDDRREDNRGNCVSGRDASPGSSSRSKGVCSEYQYGEHKRQRLSPEGHDFKVSATQSSHGSTDAYLSSDRSIGNLRNKSRATDASMRNMVVGTSPLSTGKYNISMRNRATRSALADHDGEFTPKVNAPPAIGSSGQLPSQAADFHLPLKLYDTMKPSPRVGVGEKYSIKPSFQASHGSRDAYSHGPQLGMSDMAPAALKRSSAPSYGEVFSGAHVASLSRGRKMEGRNTPRPVRLGEWRTSHSRSGDGAVSEHAERRHRQANHPLQDHLFAPRRRALEIPPSDPFSFRGISSTESGSHSSSRTGNFTQHSEHHDGRVSSGYTQSPETGFEMWRGDKTPYNASQSGSPGCDAGYAPGSTNASSAVESHPSYPGSLSWAAPHVYQHQQEVPCIPRPHVEYSGFINPENDCYACSVLTLLLRSPLFCRALLASPTVECVRPVKSANNTAATSSSSLTTSYDPTPAGVDHDTVREDPPPVSLHHVLKYFAGLLQCPQDIEGGIDMRPLRHFFRGNFFSGQQEDAHEFFLAVIDKLTEESKMFLKSTDASGGFDNPAVEEGEASKEISTDGQGTAAEGTPRSSGSESMPLWINTLITGQLLSIIRCGNAACGHEIATVDPFINLLVNIRKGEETNETLRQSNPNSSPCQESEHCAPNSEPVGSHGSLLYASPISPKPYYDVLSLLTYSFRFSALDSYVCDACGSSNQQLQGGCLLGALPPLLVVQMKRFATTYSPELGASVTKDVSPVLVNRNIVLYSLDEEHYNREEKTLRSSVLHAEQKAKQHNEGEAVDESATHVKATRCSYRLQGVVRHLGKSLYGGHYTTEFAQERVDRKEEEEEEEEEEGDGSTDGTKDGCGHQVDGERTGEGSVEREKHISSDQCAKRSWYMADDERVSALSEEYSMKEASRSCTCYLLLYEKVGEEAVSSHVWDILPRGSE